MSLLRGPKRFVWGMMRKYVSRYREHPFARRMATLAYQLYLCYENVDYNPATNGEYTVLRKIGRLYSDAIIFDVGANVGNWADEAARIFPTGRIHCFEVAPTVAERLKMRVAQEPRILVNTYGLSDHDGSVTLRFYPEDTSRTSLYEYPSVRMGSIQGSGYVRIGDTYMREHGIERITYLKIDVEGAEPFVLRGFEEALRLAKIDAIQFEYGRLNLLTNFFLRDFYALLEKYEYVIGKIYPRYVEFREYALTHEDFLGPNFLAVRMERTDLIDTLSKSIFG